MTRMMDVLAELGRLGAIPAEVTSIEPLPDVTQPLEVVAEATSPAAETPPVKTSITQETEEVLPEEEPLKEEDPDVAALAALARQQLEQIEEAVSLLRDVLGALESRIKD